MDVAAGPTRNSGLSNDERARIIREAKDLGYHSAWSTSGEGDTLDLLERYWDETHLPTGTNIIPIPGEDLAALRHRVKRFGDKCGGRFILGIGTGELDRAEWRRQHGIVDARFDAFLAKPIGMMRASIEALRPAGVPIYLAAMGPQMLHLAGAKADGALPNWMDAEHLAWARERVDEGARSAGRRPSDVKLVQYVRVSVDDEPAVARHALAKAALAYIIGRSGHPSGGPYRANMARTGLDEQLTPLEAMRENGAGDDAIADAMPDALLERLGAWGTPDEALARVKRLSQGLDLPIIRFVLARPGLESARAILKATAPGSW